MNCRKFLLSAGAVAVAATAPTNAAALLSCTPWVAPGFRQCQAGIDASLAQVTAAVVGGQHYSQWCWAACIEMVFRYYGFAVPQERIVADTWGGIVNQPAQPGQILANLNRPWIDNSGRRFSVAGDVYSANPVTAAQDLSENMPLIIGTQGHAMVLTALTYTLDTFGAWRINDAIVRDPWPGNGRRSLSEQEWFGTSFLARIRVFPA